MSNFDKSFIRGFITRKAVMQDKEDPNRPQFRDVPELITYNPKPAAWPADQQQDQQKNIRSAEQMLADIEAAAIDSVKEGVRMSADMIEAMNFGAEVTTKGRYMIVAAMQALQQELEEYKGKVVKDLSSRS